MTTYDKFSKHYDAMMGDRGESVDLLSQLIHKYHGNAKSILELACGTGALLMPLSKKYDVTGLDLSTGMLSIARESLPSVNFVKQDMTCFELDQKFDVILCVFDSINHLLNFSNWKKTYKQAYKHLNTGGIFIFDINTRAKLNRVVATTPGVRISGKDVMIMDVTNISKGVTNWNVKIFEYLSKNNYTLYEEDIQETTFEINSIKSALSKFKKVYVLDPKRTRPSSKSERLFFICKK